MIQLVLLGILLIEILFKPRLDKTRKGDMLLWYGRKQRKYKIL